MTSPVSPTTCRSPATRCWAATPDRIWGSRSSFWILGMSAPIQRNRCLRSRPNLTRRFSEIQSAIVFAFAPPPIDGLGSAGGFQMEVLGSRVAQDIRALQAYGRRSGRSRDRPNRVGRLELNISSERSAIVRRRRSRQSQEHERATGERVWNTASVSWIGIRQRLHLQQSLLSSSSSKPRRNFGRRPTTSRTLTFATAMATWFR